MLCFLHLFSHLFLLWLFLLFKDEEFAEDIVGDNNEESNSELNDVFVCELEIEDGEPQIILRHVKCILHDHDTQREQADLESKEGKETCHHEIDKLFHDITLGMEDEEFIRYISKDDRRDPCNDIDEKNIHIKADAEETDRPFYIEELIEKCENDHVDHGG
jgi:hypothetical protein